jgi:type IV secretory pathway VirD2 relaxase
MFEKQSFSAKSALREPKDDVLRGRIMRARKGSSGGGASVSLGAALGQKLAGKKVGRARSGAVRPFAVDGRQRVVAKVSFRKHGFRGVAGGGGGGNLMAHASYLQRDGAEREGEKGRFYDGRDDEVLDPTDRLQDWAQNDSRHFRITLAPESGARLVGEDGHLKEITRDTMARMERDLGVQLEWVAIDHHNTDNPHTHVIVRGVRRDGVELIIPRQYVSHGLREAARDVATDRIGERGRDDERLRLDREAHARGHTRLDQAIEQELGKNSEILLQRLGRGRDPAFADAMKARARELTRIGLAQENRRNVIAFEQDWSERLKAMRSIDVRRELARARLYEKSMGRVAGEVRELGPRGETPDRGVLVVETPDKGRLVLNTSMEAIADLQRGSLVELTPEGKRGGIERLSFHSPGEQAQVWAQTELDRELDRVARGERPRLPETPGVRSALDQRAQLLEAQRFGGRDGSGKFQFRDGAMDTLKENELKHEGKLAMRERHGLFRDVTPGNGDKPGRDGFGDENPWKVRESKELFAGKTAILERGRDVALAPIKLGMSLSVGDNVALDLAKTKQLEMTKVLGRGLGLER